MVNLLNYNEFRSVARCKGKLTLPVTETTELLCSFRSIFANTANSFNGEEYFVNRKMLSNPQTSYQQTHIKHVRNAELVCVKTYQVVTEKVANIC